MTLATPAMVEESAARLAEGLRACGARRLGLLADNGIDWLVSDLAAEAAGMPLVPLPAFFTEAQLRHAVAASGMDALLCESPRLAASLGFREAAAPRGTRLRWFAREAQPEALPAGTSKVTFTSGTTGAPKGVCLGAAQQRAVAASVAEATRGLGLRRHLCLLPLAVLLENVAGARGALAAGATCALPPLAETGLRGASGFDPLACLGAIAHWQADSVILLPQMMLALTAALEGGARRPESLRFAAVGGAKTAASLVLRARAAGLPVYEGYGLSECASVVSLNLPGADRPGSVGRPLPHNDVRIAADGEIVVAGLRTGDLGSLDADGFLYVEGRRKNLLITSFGRNVSPEWPEAELAAGSAIAQAAVFGEARPRLCAVIAPRAPEVSDAALEADVRRANARLPDYAQVAFWLRAESPFSALDGSATVNGRVRRDVVWSRYRARLESLYAKPGTEHAVL